MRGRAADFSDGGRRRDAAEPAFGTGGSSDGGPGPRGARPAVLVPRRV